MAKAPIKKQQIEGDSLEASEARVEAFKKANLCFFWVPYPWQERLLKEVHNKTTIAAISSNKIGKTAAVVNILISWLLGYEPWQYVDKDEPGAVCVEGYWYRGSSLGLKPPVNLMLTGEDWKSHIGRSLVPEFKKWLPDGWYTSKKNEQGVDYFFEMMNKSTVTVMSYSQDDSLFESFRIQGVLMDEPPPKSKYTAMSRGLLLDCGKTLLSLTPLKEAWILDDIVLSGRKDIGIVDNLSIVDNPDLYKSDLDTLALMGLNELQSKEYFNLLLYENVEKKLPVIDKGRAAEKYLEDHLPVSEYENFGKLKILKFIKDIDPSDVPPRVFGQFKSLVGRVLKEFDSSTHVIEPFEVPTDWPVIAMIDFHLSTPQMISFWTVNKQDIHFCIGEVWKNINGDEVADTIIKMKIRYGWNLDDVYIDPLSKGDVSYLKNRLGTDLRDTYSIIEDKLLQHGITLYVASKDKDSGIKNVQTALKGVNRLPTLYIFNTCERFLYEVQRWVFDEHQKPIKENDHAMENCYRYFLTGNKYEDHVIQPLPQQHYSGGVSWMGC